MDWWGWVQRWRSPLPLCPPVRWSRLSGRSSRKKTDQAVVRYRYPNVFGIRRPGIGERAIDAAGQFHRRKSAWVAGDRRGQFVVACSAGVCLQRKQRCGPSCTGEIEPSRHLTQCFWHHSGRRRPPHSAGAFCSATCARRPGPTPPSSQSPPTRTPSIHSPLLPGALASQ